MAQNLVIQNQGLSTNPAPFALPKGSLVEAKNVVYDRPGIIETRRGFQRYGTQFSMTGSETFNKLFNFKDRILVHYKDKIKYDSDGLGTFTDYSGTYVPVADKIRAIEAANSFFFTTNAGIKKIEALTSTPIQAGVPR